MSFYGNKWITYTPTWTNSAGGSLALNNGTLTGRYLKQGKLCFIYISLLCGSTTTYGTGGGEFRFALPINASVDTMLSGSYFDTSANAGTGRYFVVTGITQTSYVKGFSTGTEPINPNTLAWAAGDTINFSGSYQCV